MPTAAESTSQYKGALNNTETNAITRGSPPPCGFPAIRLVIRTAMVIPTIPGAESQYATCWLSVPIPIFVEVRSAKAAAEATDMTIASSNVLRILRKL